MPATRKHFFSALLGGLFVLLVGGVLYFKVLRCERIVFTPELNSSTNDGVRRNILSHRAYMLGLIDSLVLSYPESRKFLLAQADARRMDEITICRDFMWNRPAQSVTGLVVAFGDSWRKTIKMTQRSVVVVAIAPQSSPPDIYQYENLMVVLGFGDKLTQTNNSWKEWCQLHEVPYTTIENLDIIEMSAAIVRVEQSRNKFENDRREREARKRLNNH